MSKTKSTIIISLILIAIVFYGGYKYGQSNSSGAGLSQASGTTRQFAGRGSRNNAGGDLIRGGIIKKDAESLSIALPTGGSQIIWYSTSTEIQKTVPGRVDDLVIGGVVSISGQANSDGSLTAKTIQMRSN
jgi:hypothetical protein